MENQEFQSMQIWIPVRVHTQNPLLPVFPLLNSSRFLKNPSLEDISQPPWVYISFPM